jgi:hypothetical protein
MELIYEYCGCLFFTCGQELTFNALINMYEYVFIIQLTKIIYKNFYFLFFLRSMSLSNNEVTKEKGGLCK